MEGENRPILIFIAILSGIIASAHIGKISVALPFILSDLQVSTINAGYLLSVFSISAVVLCLLIGMIVNRQSVIFFIGLGFTFLSAGGFWGSSSEGYGSFLSSRIIEGIGFVLIIVSAPCLISVCTNARSRKNAMLLWGIALPTGVSLEILLFSPFIKNEQWENYWQALAVLSAVICILFMAIHWYKWKSIFPFFSINWSSIEFNFDKYKGVFLLASVFFLFNLQNIAVVAWLGKLIVDYLKLQHANITILSSTIILMNVIGNLTVFAVRKKLKLPALLIFVQLCIAFSILCFFVVKPMSWKLPFLYSFSFFGGMVPGTLMSHVSQYMKRIEDVPNGVGLLVFGDNLGALAGPTVFAYLMFFSGNWWGFVFVPFVALAIMIAISLALMKLEIRY